MCLDGKRNDQMAFHALADYQNHVIGWLQWEQSSLGDGAVVRFPRIWMSSGECRIIGLTTSDISMFWRPTVTVQFESITRRTSPLGGLAGDDDDEAVTFELNVNNDFLFALAPPASVIALDRGETLLLNEFVVILPADIPALQLLVAVILDGVPVDTAWGRC